MKEKKKKEYGSKRDGAESAATAIELGTLTDKALLPKRSWGVEESS